MSLAWTDKMANIPLYLYLIAYTIILWYKFRWVHQIGCIKCDSIQFWLASAHMTWHEGRSTRSHATHSNYYDYNENNEDIATKKKWEAGEGAGEIEQKWSWLLIKWYYISICHYCRSISIHRIDEFSSFHLSGYVRMYVTIIIILWILLLLLLLLLQHDRVLVYLL